MKKCKREIKKNKVSFCHIDAPFCVWHFLGANKLSLAHICLAFMRRINKLINTKLQCAFYLKPIPLKKHAQTLKYLKLKGDVME